MQGDSMKSIRRTSINPRQACASSEEWWNNPMYLGDLWRQLRHSYNRAVADTQLSPSSPAMRLTGSWCSGQQSSLSL